MNKLIFIISIAITTMAMNNSMAQDGFTINGTIDKSIKLDSVYIYSESFKGIKAKLLARAKVKDGKFTMKGKVDQPQRVMFGNARANFGDQMILENAKYTINAGKYTISIVGGKINTMVFGFYNTKNYKELSDEYSDKYHNFKPSDTAANHRMDVLFDEMCNIEDLHFAKLINDPNTPTIAKMLALTSSSDDKRFDTKKRYELLYKYEKELGKHINIDVYRAFLNDEEKNKKMGASVSVGKKYKSIAGLNVNGKKVSIDGFIGKNKYTLLEFWASWCGPCRGEIPNLKKAYAKYKDKGFEIFSFSIDQKEAMWKKALKEENTKWINVISNGKKGAKQIQSYGVSGVPASFLIDSSGIIVAVNDDLRGENLEEVLSMLFKE